MQELKAIVVREDKTRETVSLGNPDHVVFIGIWTVFLFDCEPSIVLNYDDEIEFDINENRYILRIKQC